MHNSENPGAILVTTPLSGAGNYHSWSRAILIALEAKNKTAFIDSSLPRPDDDDLLFVPWKRCNSMVKSWLLNTVSKEFANSLLCFQNAVDIWTDLRSRFLESDGPRIFDIKKSLTALTQGSMDVNSYYNKMKILWDELDGYDESPACVCRALQSWLNRQQKEAVFQFLMGLNDSFSQVRGHILLMEPLPPLAKVFSLVLREEGSVRSPIISPLLSVHLLLILMLHLQLLLLLVQRDLSLNALIVGELVTLWINVSKFMDIPVDQNLNQLNIVTNFPGDLLMHLQLHWTSNSQMSNAYSSFLF